MSDSLSCAAVPGRFATHGIAHLPFADQQLFERFGRGCTQPIPYACIHHAFSEQVLRQPAAIAAQQGEVQISYAELDHQAQALAAYLAQIGVRPGDAVGIFLQRSIAMLVSILAVLKCGAAYVPQDVRSTPAQQLVDVVQSAAIQVVLGQGVTRHLLPIGPRSIDVDAFMAQPHRAYQAPRDLCTADSTCFVLFTSGTTGRRNGVRVSHANLCNILFSADGALGMAPGQTVGQILNIAFDMAAWEILGSLVHGATLLIRGSDIGYTAQACTVLIATPSILATLDPGRCSALQTVAVAGEPCPPALARRWARHCVFYNGCGPTETTIVNTLQRYPGCGPLTIGKPTPNNTVYILDASGRACRIGEIGEMWAGGNGVSQGYLNNPRLTQERYRADPFLGGARQMFRTRDLGRWTANGELEHLGRTDDQVKIRGFRVELDGIAAILESVPGCQRAVVLKRDDRSLVAFASPATLDHQAALQQCRAHLPYYSVPVQLTLLDELPLTERGKIDRHALHALQQSLELNEGQA